MTPVIKDLKRLLNNERIQLHWTEAPTEFVIMCFENNKPVLDTVSLSKDYSNIFECADEILKSFKLTNLVSCQFDSNKPMWHLAVTESGNLELFGCRHALMSKNLTTALSEYYRKVDLVSSYTDWYMSSFDNGGGFTFNIGKESSKTDE